MTPKILFTLILLFVLIDFVLNRVLSYLNTKNWKDDIPEEMKGTYDQEAYSKARDYEITGSRFSMISASFSLILLLLMLFLNGFAFFDEFVRQYTTNTYWMPMMYFGLLVFLSDLLGLPFSVYSTFVIEEKFGFNKTTVKTFVLDKLKGYLIGGLIGGGILAAFIWFYETVGPGFWLPVWIFLAVFSLFMMMFYTSLIVPLFNKLKPLEAGVLRSGIEAYCKEVGFQLTNLFVIDGSKRSSKSNAYFSGLGPKKKIVLYDTLIEKQQDDEIIAVLAHEIGHYKLKHTLSSAVLSILQTGVMLYLLSLVVSNEMLGQALGVDQMSLHIGLIAFSFLYAPISTLTGIMMNVFSRRNEFQADAYAAKTNSGSALISALKKLSVDNLSNLNPHPAYVFVHYSHPPILKRIASIKNLSKH